MKIKVLWPLLILCFALNSFISCTKLISIDPPTTSITTQEVFSDSANATAGLLGAYFIAGSTGGNLILTNGGLSVYTGSSADELLDFNQDEATTLNFNTLTSDSRALEDYFWPPAYQIIYSANACIEGVKNAPGVPTATQNQITGEAKFLRALVNFYMVNLFGDIPLITTTDYKVNALLPRASSTVVYQAIEDDLHDVERLLPSDYSISGGQRTRACKWAATALLARLYLYNNKYDSAEIDASSLINNVSMFGLASTPDSVFLVNSSEQILQWNLNTNAYPYNATTEGFSLVPSIGNNPSYYITDQLLSAFEPGDLRRTLWVDSIDYSGTTYYIPYKYKIGPDLSQANASPREFYSVLRLAEQYLIRAEARAKKGTNLNGAIDDINLIRTRSLLAPLSYGLTSNQIIAAVAQERRIELFAEWGHRWFDLKRSGTIDAVMSYATPLKNGGSTWRSYQQLYPIPLLELRVDRNLKQNMGY